MKTRSAAARWTAAALVPAVLTVATVTATRGQQRRPRPPEAAAATQPADAAPSAGTNSKADDGKRSTTDHQITLDGRPFPYAATAAELTLKDEAGKARASLFYVAYDAKPADGPKPDPGRPLTFLFNGGPGSAAVWLHLGGMGPRIVELDDHSMPVGPPYKLVDNPNTWLPASDLVFVDPVGTGYSRAAPGVDAKQFYGFRNDLETCADFIRSYVTKHGDWGRPIYLAGESYGTTRCAALAGYLADRYGLQVNGVTLVSTVLDFGTLQPSAGNDLPYELYLPSYAAVAWYHKKLGPDLQADFDKTIAAARKFTADEYVPALAKGAALPAEDRAHVVKRVAAFTGLTEAYVDKANLRIGPSAFEKGVLGGDGRQIVGRYDARITGYDPAAARGSPGFDPSFSYYLPAYSSTFNQYVRDELKYETDLPYEVLSDQVRPWSFNDERGNPLYVTDDLQDALLQHPGLRVHFVSGYYDLATPFFAADYTIDRMNLSPEARRRVSHSYYPSGHMIYHNHESAKQLAEAEATFMHPPAGPTTKP